MKNSVLSTNRRKKSKEKKENIKKTNISISQSMNKNKSSNKFLLTNQFSISYLNSPNKLSLTKLKEEAHRKDNEYEIEFDKSIKEMQINKKLLENNKEKIKKKLIIQK
jgi:hypothetical protein